MKSIFAYIFNHKDYNNVVTTYDKVIKNYKSAYEVWMKQQSRPLLKGYEHKEIVAEHFSEIRTIDSWMKTYSQLIRSNKEAVDRFIGTKSSYHSFVEIQRVGQSKNRIENIASVLKEAHRIEHKYSKAWKNFSHGRIFDDIPLDELNTVDEEKFEIKNCFLALYDNHAKLISLIAGCRKFCLNSFSKDEIDSEAEIIHILSSNESETVTSFNADICIDDEKKLKRAILDSIYYGEKCNFTDSFTIADFYDLRSNFDEIGIPFDDAVLAKQKNANAIKAFNKAKYGKSEIYISDYFDVVKVGSELFLYVEKYNQEQESREAAKHLRQIYSMGFNAIYGTIDLDECDFSLILEILNSETNINSKDRELQEIERERKEAEQRRRDEERKQQEKNALLKCVSDWYTHTWNGSVKHKWCCDYYSYKNYKDYATSEMWDAWKFIWSFKNDPFKNVSEYEHDMALNRAVKWTENILSETFGTDVSKLTLVCLTASTRMKNDRRFKLFAEKVCSDLNMYNAYNHINIVADGEAKHEGGTVAVGKSYDANWFKNKYIVLFDDVRTSGNGIEHEKRILESFGATIICAITLGQTKSW